MIVKNVQIRENLGNLKFISYVFLGGSIFDDKKGTAHFLEHIFYDKLSKIAENVPCDFNAFTSSIISSYVILSDLKNIDFLDEKTSEIFNEENIDDETIERQRNIILSEIRRKESNFTEYLKSDLSLRSCLKCEKWKTFSNLGTSLDVLSIDKNDLINFFRKRYRKMCYKIIISGNCNERNEINVDLNIDWIKVKFRNIEERKDTKASFLSINYVCKTDIRYLLLSFYLLHPSTKTFKRIRSECGCYSVYSTLYELLPSLSVFEIIFEGINEKKIDKAIEIIHEEIEKIRRGFIDRNRFKNTIKRLIIRRELYCNSRNYLDLYQNIVRNLFFYGKTCGEMTNIIKDCTEEDLINFVNSMSENFGLASILPM